MSARVLAAVPSAPHVAEPTAPSSEPTRLTYRPREVAALLGLPLSTIHDLVNRGVLGAVRLGGAEILETKSGVRRRRRGVVLIPVEAVAEMLERFRVPTRSTR